MRLIAWAIAEHVAKAGFYCAIVASCHFLFHHQPPRVVGESIVGDILYYLYTACLLAASLFGFRGFKTELEWALKRHKLPPGTFGLPLVGEIFSILILYKANIVQFISDKAKRYGNIFMSVLVEPNVVLGGADHLQWLFQADRKRQVQIAWPPNIQDLLGPTAVANLSGPHHRHMRRLLEPFFAPAFVQKYFGIMDEITQSELQAWSATNDFCSSQVFKMYALKLFLASSFGHVDEDVMKRLHDDFIIWIGGFLSLTGNLRVPGTAFDKAMHARDRILALVKDLIEQFERDNAEDSDRAQNTIVGRFIYARDEEGNRLTRPQMEDNILNLIFAGHDTTFASISTVLHHLVQHPDFLQALEKEVSQFREPLTVDQLKNEAPILNAVMWESLRMDPPVPGGFRKSNQPLDYNGYRFEAGTTFNYSVLLTAGDDSLYPQARTKFAPQRFLPSDHPLQHKNTSDDLQSSTIDPSQGRSNYPIFGGGTHVCLGKHFALLELRVILARMVQHYHIETRSDVKVDFPVNGWQVDFKLTPRKKLEWGPRVLS